MEPLKRILVKELPLHTGGEVRLEGWIHRTRALKSVTFVMVRDRSGIVQCTFSPDLLEGQSLSNESVVRITGKVVEQKNAFGPYEIEGMTFELINGVQEALPIIVNGEVLDVQLDTLLNHRVLGLRHAHEQSIFKIQAVLSNAFGRFLRENDFLEMHTPKLVKEGAEGGANVFSLDYFGEKAYLAQSPQFYKQMMVIAGFERVFEVGSVFRAEAHSTRRHLNEYVSLDLEMGFIESEQELMAFETELLRHMIDSVEKESAGALEVLGVSLPVVPDVIPQMKLSDAIALLKEQYGKTELEGDLDPEGEKLISEVVLENTGSPFLFLTHYPAAKRPMYTLPCGEHETHSFDLLFRGLEITTGGMRIYKYDDLVKSMLKKGQDPEKFGSYLEAFKYGAPSHGGLAIGLERLTAQLLGYPNIRRTSLFPRDGSRLTP